MDVTRIVTEVDAEIRSLGTPERTWALVDALATSVVGYLVEQHQEIEPVLDRWAKDDDFWIRRTALLALLPTPSFMSRRLVARWAWPHVWVLACGSSG